MESSTPIAYLVTLRTFGTWLHGDARGSHAQAGGKPGRYLPIPGSGRGTRARYTLWTVRSRDQAVHYVVHGQDVQPSAI